MSEIDARKLIEQVGTRFNTLASAIGLPAIKDQMMGFSVDFQEVLGALLTRIERLEAQLKDSKSDS